MIHRSHKRPRPTLLLLPVPPLAHAATVAALQAVARLRPRLAIATARTVKLLFLVLLSALAAAFALLAIRLLTTIVLALLLPAAIVLRTRPLFARQIRRSRHFTTRIRLDVLAACGFRTTAAVLALAATATALARALTGGCGGSAALRVLRGWRRRRNNMRLRKILFCVHASSFFSRGICGKAAQAPSNGQSPSVGAPDKPAKNEM